jgi:hypothetical protein
MIHVHVTGTGLAREITGTCGSAPSSVLAIIAVSDLILKLHRVTGYAALAISAWKGALR